MASSNLPAIEKKKSWRQKNHLHKEGRVGIPSTDLTPPHICSCLQPRPGFPTSYVHCGIFYRSVSSVKMRGNCLFCWYWWNWWPLLFKLSFLNSTDRVMVFNATFNNISVILYMWWLVWSVEETGVPGENHRPAASHWQTLSHIVDINYTKLSWEGFELTMLSVIGTDYISSCKSNYYTTTMTPNLIDKRIFFLQ